jgi:hypothetical protein
MADQSQPRIIRVFVSATLTDLQAERDYLHKSTFSRLRQLCESRDVILEVVDIRSGVADEATASENVLQLTLQELRRGRPYYIGLLGKSYGSTIEHIPNELLSRWPLLAAYRRRSTTELEIVCGVLADETMRGRGFFYFRDPKALDNSEQEVAEDLDQDSQNALRLEDLKQSIRDVAEQGICRLRENYRSAEELGDWILDDFTRLIDDLWPVAESQTESTPHPYHDDVMFTVYRPGTVLPQKWYSLLAFAHLAERPLDAAPEKPDPLAEVQRQAQMILGEEMSEYRQSSQDSSSAVSRAGEITFKPFIEGFDFNPASRSFGWEESVHREEFKMRAATAPDGEVAKGWLRVYLGPLILAQINLSIKVDSKSVLQTEKQPALGESARPLRQVFASYSHKDRAIVERIEAIVSQTHLGIEYLRDATNLRAGEEWSPKLMEMIKGAQAFQLFWSTNSMNSRFVRQEYQYALSLRRRDFVLPVYWETPFPEKTDENLPPDELRRLHFENLSGSTTTSHHSASEPLATGSIGAPSYGEHSNPQIIGEKLQVPTAAITMELAQPNEADPSNVPTDRLEEPPVLWPGHASEPLVCHQCGAAPRGDSIFCHRCGVSLQNPSGSGTTGALSQPSSWPSEDLASPRDYPTLSGRVEVQPVESFTPIYDDFPRSLPAASPPGNSDAYARGSGYAPETSLLPAAKMKKRSLTAILGGLAAAVGFLIFIPVALIGLATATSSGTSGPAAGGGALILILFLFFLAALVIIGGGAAVIVLILKGKR